MRKAYGRRVMETHLDYLRLATWDELAYTRVAARLMSNWETGWEHGKWLQYRGWRKEGLFLGSGLQQCKYHSVLNISGSLSHQMLPSLRSLATWYATRIDLQVTIKTPLGSGDRLALVRDDCKTENTTLIESQENDTLYLGARASDKFTRLYEKNLDQQYLRLEFELKGARSRKAWQAILRGEELHRIFSYYVKKSKLPKRVRQWFTGAKMSATTEAMNQQRITEATKQLEWLMSLETVVNRMMADHEIGEQTKLLVRKWALSADTLDKN